MVRNRKLWRGRDLSRTCLIQIGKGLEQKFYPRFDVCKFASPEFGAANNGTKSLCSRGLDASRQSAS
jgi:hypothetical protein